MLTPKCFGIGCRLPSIHVLPLDVPGLRWVVRLCASCYWRACREDPAFRVSHVEEEK